MTLALLLYTTQRRSDMVRMGWQHVQGDRLLVTQKKTGSNLSLPIRPKLMEVIEGTPRDNLTFLTTDFGLPFTANGFGNKMRDWCNQAELPHCSAHGLRKAASPRLAEEQIRAMTGHKTDKEVARYTEAADQKILSDQAIDAFDGAEGEQENGYPSEGLAKNSAQALEIQEPEKPVGGGDWIRTSVR